VASALTRLGFKKGDLLYFVTYETAVLYLVQMGVWRLGGCVRGGYQMETEGTLFFLCLHENLLYYLIDLAEEYARQMREGKVKFLLVDAETYPRLKAAIKMLDWSVTLLSFGDLNNADIVQVTDLLKDDGSGKFGECYNFAFQGNSLSLIQKILYIFF
jgi:hypothetical protein